MAADIKTARRARKGARKGEKRGARERLLLATINYGQKNGLGDLTLRQLAAALGTSHRMLCYHFGSKEGLLVEVTRAIEAENQREVGRLVADSHLSAVEAMRGAWARAMDPHNSTFLRLYIEVYVQALHGKPHTTDFLNNITRSWLGPLTQLSLHAGVPAKLAPTDARLFLAVARGLLLDLLATGDLEAAEAAYELFLSRYEGLSARHRAKGASRKRTVH